MALQDPQAEPSMEEILASIRRIISEDEAAPAPAPPEPVLELSKPAPQPPPVQAEDDDLLVFDKEEPPPVMTPRETVAPTPFVAPQPVDTIVSEPVVSAAAHSFTRLAGSLKVSDAHGQTLDGIVRELLRPMLRDWLEQNLPTIVESKVEAELDRISRLAR